MTKILIYILAFAIWSSCTTGKKSNTLTKPASMVEEDTSKPIVYTTFKSHAYPEIFEAAFSNSTIVVEGIIKYQFLRYNIGKIKSESGKFVACDPSFLGDASPFNELFPIGDFDVDLSIAKMESDNRVAFSRIIFSKNPITKWEFALLQGQKEIPLTDTSMYCYGVDAGMGLFIDSVANKYFAKMNPSTWEKIFVNDAVQNGYIYSIEGHNLATFSTGYGDGCYSTFIGRDSIGNPCQLLTDFGLVSWWKLPQQ